MVLINLEDIFGEPANWAIARFVVTDIERYRISTWNQGFWRL